jgi:hypothetical protein
MAATTAKALFDAYKDDEDVIGPEGERLPAARGLPPSPRPPTPPAAPTR